MYQTGYQLKSNEVTEAAINLEDELELVILLMFGNNEHFNAVIKRCDHATGADQQSRQGLHKGMRAGQWWSYMYLM